MSQAKQSPLISCPDCGKEHSRLAVTCPNCARPNAQPPQDVQKKSVFDKELGAGGAIYLLMIPLGIIGCYLFGQSILGIVGAILIAVGAVGLLIRIVSTLR